ncbi:hypothetical protein INT45_003577 [Circinella minor]|uniref:Endonuclease/exonuclease/phosphatase domain-containing protein n=1 Tax=Circinella minor TaxID=1195481 RepID=A0A8H7S5I4_9FUNG|nr:hypothetical protein INT45_003577 [Circinella minor]
MSNITISLININGLVKQTINTITNSLPTSSLIFLTETWLLSPSWYPTNWFQHHNYALPVKNFHHENLTIYCLYLPPSNLTPIDALEIIQSIPLLTSSDNNHENTIFCGDFNARQKELLGDQRTTPRETAFANWIEEQGLYCWNSQRLHYTLTYIS